MSKFSLEELKESVEYYNEKGSPVVEAKRDKGYSLAILHHKGRNKHHSTYWIDFLKEGKMVLIEMPREYVGEMICDWLGARKAYEESTSPNPYDEELLWWVEHRDDFPMHELTKLCVKNYLMILAQTCDLGNVDEGWKWIKEDIKRNKNKKLLSCITL